MIQWKQRLYAFLLRRVLGPLLDASATKKLHDSIEFSLHEGKFILKDISLNADYLSERLLENGSVVSIRRATVERLEIQFTLRENVPLQPSSTTPAPQSSFAWRAIKLGGGVTKETSLPAVSLVADIHVHGVNLELVPVPVPVDPSQRTQQSRPTTPTGSEEETMAAKSMIGSYIDAALASLSLTLKLSNIHIKMCHRHDDKETWVAVRFSSMTYKDLEASSVSSAYRMVINKSIELSEITIHVGDEAEVSRSTLVAMAQGTGRGYFRMMEYPSTTNGKKRNLSQDIEITLNHQLNVSLDQYSLRLLQRVADRLIQTKEPVEPDTNMTMKMMAAQNSLSHLKKTWVDNEDEDREDLKTITGIMKQYREAYHLAEMNQLRGGILVPSHAYMDDLDALEEDEAMTFDVFFDATDQSFYNAASILRESVLMRHDACNDQGDSIQTKLRLHILSGCFKINFKDLTQRSQLCMIPQEYILLTMDDVNISLSSARHRSELAVSVAHFEIEDAQLDLPNKTSQTSGTIDVGSMFCCVSESQDTDDYGNDMVVSQAPCMTFHLQVSEELKSVKCIDCNITLLPIEAVVRQRSLANLINFANDFSHNKQNETTQQSLEQDQASEQAHVSFTCHVPSLTVSIPLLKSTSTAPFFNRRGETLRNAVLRKAHLGITLNTIEFQWTSGDPANCERGLESSAILDVCHILIFACAPVGDKISLDTKMQRTDFILLNGRTEVDPYIPITLQYKKASPSSNDGSLGREFFPIVPTISSFKARQEDEDDEMNIDRLLFSKLRDVDAESRKNLRGTEPQIAMVTDAEKSVAVLCLSIPEVIVDLTKTELETLQAMIESAKPEHSPANAKNLDDNSSSKAPCLSFRLDVEQMTLALKEDFCIEDLYATKTVKDRFSCLLAVNKIRTHFLLNESELRHIRLVMHDLAFYSALHPRIDADVHHTERDLRKRVGLMKERIRIYIEAAVSPIFFRSKIFTPICQDAPCILIDMRDTTTRKATEVANGFSQKQLHVTLYHLTIRHDLDSDWIKKLIAILPKLKTTDLKESPVTKHDEPPSMTRLFLSVADCNLDYSSPAYFQMESRSIVRFGDFRFSSNIMTPANRQQAYSISLGDLFYHISNQRVSHVEENKKLCRAPILMPGNLGRTRRGVKDPIHGTTAEALLRELGFVDILGLDSMDAVVVITKGDNTEPDNEPVVTTSLTFGLVSINACKDSFHCFAGTIGELQAKLTALTDEELSRIRDASPRKDQSTAALAASPTKQAPLHCKSNERDQEQENSEPFLLDGYEWTEIDHDPLREFKIPDGDEQVTGWYKSSSSLESPIECTNVDTSSATSNLINRFPGRIIHHHFPFHSISNPMADGDMGAAKYAGDGAKLTVKSRILIHKLAVKLRFYDGYDWPANLSDREKKYMCRNGNFVIQPLPRTEVTKVKEHLANEIAKKLADDDTEHIKRKVAIMADLLANDETDEKRSPFECTPLPEDKAKRIEQETEIRRLARKTKLYLQVSVNGVTVRLDALETSPKHRLASVMSVSIADLFIAETASLSCPVKMLGEWINENEHPRDTRYGTVMLKVITWKPLHPLTDQNEVESDDCEVAVQLLPMRAIIDQRAIHFAQAFFRQEENEHEDNKEIWSSGLHLIPPPRFRSFRVKSWKLKVDYIPQKLDVSALREGSIVELINISPIDGMVITLSQVSVEGVVGVGEVMGGLTSNWLQEIVSTQLHKFLANARPFEPITDVGQGLSDLVVLPFEAFKNGEDVRRAMTTGIKSLAETVTFQALTTSSRLTEYAANKMASVVGGRYHSSTRNALPARPTSAPKGIQDVTGHAMESLARGFHAANYKVVIVPYREYNRSGAAGAVTSVLRGIPVMLVAPVTGATEALSYTLLGARNALRPDIRREEEAARTGFASYDV